MLGHDVADDFKRSLWPGSGPLQAGNCVISDIQRQQQRISDDAKAGRKNALSQKRRKPSQLLSRPRQ
jgi:hypothetical protein